MKAKTLLLFVGIISLIQLSYYPVNGREEPEAAKIQEDEGTDVVEQPVDEKVDEHWIKNKAKSLNMQSFDEQVVDPETRTMREGNPWFI
jgi:hypothetical protein